MQDQIFHKIVEYELLIPRMDVEISEDMIQKKIRGRYQSIYNWFAGNEEQENEAAKLFDATNEIIRRITRYATQLSEKNTLGANRKEEYKKIAEIFMKCEDLADAHKMAAMVFGLEKPFHIAADSIRETDSINKGVYEENPFLVELKPRVRTYREKTRRSSIIEAKEKKMEMKKAFLSLPEEEAFKYFDIFKHTLSGTIGKNLINMEFPLDQELNGGTQEFLMRLKDSKLQDDLLLEEFYDKVVESYEYGENYYIILIHAVYDVPGKTKDGLEMEDASDTVYEHILCSICPVNLTKAGLTYNAQTNNIEDRIRDWFVEAPVKGFLFPAFQDRATDVHNVLYYTKKPEELQPYFVEHVLGSTTPLTAGDQKTTFQVIVSDTLGEDSDYEVVRNIHDNLNEMIEQSKEEPEPLELSKTDVRKLLTRSGVAEEKLESFDDEFDETVGIHGTLLASNIASAKTFQIETPDVVVKVNPERADLVETRDIDGRRCLVIAIDDHLEVNGIEIH